MRIISGYDPTGPDRETAIEVTATPAGESAVDITDIVRSVRVMDTLERAPSTAQLELERQPESWNDPVGDSSSPLTPGSRLEIKMGERGGTMTRIFDGEILSGETGEQDPAARTPIRAVGGRQHWWKRKVVSEVYTSQDSDNIVKDMFQDFGGLGPTEFDLPGDGRIITYLQTFERPIMAVAFDLYEPAEHVPWWDPVQQKLSTLDCDIPASADVTLPRSLRRDPKFGWQVPEATRVIVDGGTLRNVERVEVNTWSTVVNRLSTGELYDEGVRWAAGTKTDALVRSALYTDSPYWADAWGNNPHWGIWQQGDYLYINFAKNLMDTSWGDDGYKGPVGIRFLTNNPAISTEPVSILVFTQTFGEKGLWQGAVFEEEFSTVENRQRCYVQIRVDVDDQAMPPPGGYMPGKYWQEMILDDSDVQISWDITGRQVAPDSLEQLSAQAWDDDLIAAHGDVLKQVSNETLLVENQERKAVEDEAVRQMEVVKVARYPAVLPLAGQDLRLLPGDCIRTAHPRDDYDVLVWARQVQHTWEEGGRAQTQIQGCVVGTV